MDLSQIRELLKIVADSGVAEVEIEEDDFRLVVRRMPAQVSLLSPPAMQVPVPQPMGYPPPAYPPQPVYAAPPPPAVPQAPASPAAPAPATPTEEAPAPINGHTIKAPIVGTFYSAPSPDSDPFVSVGDRVSVGDTLCIIEAMKLMNEIESEVAGTIKEILIDNSSPVEYDQPLFIVEKS